MSYSWLFKQSRITVKGSEHLGEIGAGQQFESQEEAEAWLSETWPELQDAGIDEVTPVSYTHLTLPTIYSV